MIDNRKEQERAELHRTIWGIANDLRGSVDGWDFKQYVLGMLFYRYISENLSSYINEGEHASGDTAFNYAELADSEAEEARDDLVKTKGFFILPSELFENVLKRSAADENLNETLESVFKNVEASAQGTDSEANFKGLFDDIDVNSNKLGGTVARRNERLVKLMSGVAAMKLGDYKDNTIDAFGDAYEFLMGMYASNAGKSGGEYYTPQEVSELLTRIALVGKKEVNKVYEIITPRLIQFDGCQIRLSGGMQNPLRGVHFRERVCKPLSKPQKYRKPARAMVIAPAGFRFWAYLSNAFSANPLTAPTAISQVTSAA